MIGRMWRLNSTEDGRFAGFEGAGWASEADTISKPPTIAPPVRDSAITGRDMTGFTKGCRSSTEVRIRARRRFPKNLPENRPRKTRIKKVFPRNTRTTRKQSFRVLLI